MGTKSYVKPICVPRVYSHLLVGSCVNTNEIQSPCFKGKVINGKKILIKNLYEERKKYINKLNQKDRELVEELSGGYDDSHDDH